MTVATQPVSHVEVKRGRFAKDERTFAGLLVAPGIVVLLLTTTGPLVYLIWTSLHEVNLSMPWITGFVGIEHYVRMWGDSGFWHSLGLTAIYTVSTVVLQLVVGLGLALMVLKIPASQWLFRLVAILPIVLAPVVVGLFWRTLMLAPAFGIFDVVTRETIGRSYNWLGDPTLALVSVILIHTWQWTPFAFLVLLASLASVPPDLYEAARVDRAGAIARFRHITLPMIRPAIIIVVIMRAMIALSAFAAIYAATGGGPGTATQILNLYAYQTSFVALNFGYGSALAVALLVITLAVSGLLFSLRTSGRKT
jgi:multiple sugar transport system permease protein